MKQLGAGPATCLTTTLIHLSTEIASTQTLKACPYTGLCCQRSAESTINLEKTATLESSANMFMHAVCAVNSAAGVKYLGSNSLEFNATYVDKRLGFRLRSNISLPSSMTFLVPVTLSGSQ